MSCFPFTSLLSGPLQKSDWRGKLLLAIGQRKHHHHLAFAMLDVVVHRGRSCGLDSLLHIEPLGRGDQAGRLGELHASRRVWVIGHGVAILHPYAFALQFLHVFEMLRELHADHGHVVGREMLLGCLSPGHAGVLPLMPDNQQVRSADRHADNRGNENLLPGPQVCLRDDILSGLDEPDARD